MLQEIKNHLSELEKRENIKILVSIESGSRAWGFPSPDSDYDIRVIYIKNPEWYLSIDNKNDNIDYFHGKLLDINGWDIRKTLRLLRKSNATPFEWNQSPIVYRENPEFQKRLQELAELFFQPRHSFNHYMGIARNSFKSLEGETIKLKKLFYVIRPLLAAKWIMKNKSIPPMDIDNLFPVMENEFIKSKIKDLIKMKATANEDFIYNIDSNIKEYIVDQFELLEENTLEEVEKVDTKILDEFYRELLNM